MGAKLARSELLTGLGFLLWQLVSGTTRHPLDCWARLSRSGGSSLVIISHNKCFWLKGCTRSWGGWLEAAIFNCPFQTTTSLVQCLPRAAGAILLGLVSGLEIVILCAGCGFWVFGSCKSRVFQSLRAPFSPVVRGN
ncbi:unnamed protein product [Brassica rapa]|uniref:Uncharacterized protein n=1 Tax=Brassica campestris TaxID=3711 RepID=A0A8D9DL42_BRACM|nr:unnamed protein product [Brassica rapa]